MMCSLRPLRRFAMSFRMRTLRPSGRASIRARVLGVLMGPARSSGRFAGWLLLPLMLVGAFLVYFHALLLWQRVTDQTLFEPLVGLRWLGSLALLLGWYALQRRDIPLLWGRRAAVLWLLVLLLHVSFPAPANLDPVALFGPDGEAMPGLLMLPVAAGLALLTAHVLRILRRTSRRSVGAPPGGRPEPFGRPPVARLRSGFGHGRFARPPPLAAH